MGILKKKPKIVEEPIKVPTQGNKILTADEFRSKLRAIQARAKAAQPKSNFQ